MYYTPLRYPGGKGKLAPFIETIIDVSGHRGGTYIEPFAGGAGVALSLLHRGVVADIVINDYDKGIYSFWKAILEETDRFVEALEIVKVSVEEWEKQREICIRENKKYSFELGFATFFLNRTNRSGIISGGIIGGKNQNGNWKIDARFNKNELTKRIRGIAAKKKHIHVYNKDAGSFIDNYLPKYVENAFMYLDPPYYKKGRQLYLNFFSHNDHVRIEQLVNKNVNCDWIITYDNTEEILDIYKGYNVMQYELNYSLSDKKKAEELIFFSNERIIPSKDILRQRNVNVDLRKRGK